jgi:hypothetical protein
VACDGQTLDTALHPAEAALPRFLQNKQDHKDDPVDGFLCSSRNESGVKASEANLVIP